MLKLIYKEYDKFVDDWMGLDIGDANALSNFKPLQDKILDAMEEAGMLPPYVGLGEEDDWGFLDYETKWEDEDEEK